jgi:thioredoxin 1
VGAVIAIVGISFGARSNRFTGAVPPKGQSDTNTQKTGEPAMLASTKQGSEARHAKRAGEIQHADEANFERLVLNSDVPVLVDFYADWCGPCRMVAPVLEELARETTDAKIVKVNVDHSPQLAARYDINSIPSLKVFDDGTVTDQHVGLANKARLKKMLGI